jgi:hypothetical protein
VNNSLWLSASAILSNSPSRSPPPTTLFPSPLPLPPTSPLLQGLLDNLTSKGLATLVHQLKRGSRQDEHGHASFMGVWKGPSSPCFRRLDIKIYDAEVTTHEDGEWRGVWGHDWERPSATLRTSTHTLALHTPSYTSIHSSSCPRPCSTLGPPRTSLEPSVTSARSGSAQEDGRCLEASRERPLNCQTLRW